VFVCETQVKCKIRNLNQVEGTQKLDSDFSVNHEKIARKVNFYDTEVIHVPQRSHFAVMSAGGRRATLLSALQQQGRYLSVKGRHQYRNTHPARSKASTSELTAL